MTKDDKLEFIKALMNKDTIDDASSQRELNEWSPFIFFFENMSPEKIFVKKLLSHMEEAFNNNKTLYVITRSELIPWFIEYDINHGALASEPNIKFDKEKMNQTGNNGEEIDPSLLANIIHYKLLHLSYLRFEQRLSNKERDIENYKALFNNYIDDGYTKEEAEKLLRDEINTNKQQQIEIENNFVEDEFEKEMVDYELEQEEEQEILLFHKETNLASDISLKKPRRCLYRDKSFVCLVGFSATVLELLHMFHVGIRINFILTIDCNGGFGRNEIETVNFKDKKVKQKVDKTPQENLINELSRIQSMCTDITNEYLMYLKSIVVHSYIIPSKEVSKPAPHEKKKETLIATEIETPSEEVVALMLIQLLSKAEKINHRFELWRSAQQEVLVKPGIFRQESISEGILPLKALSLCPVPNHNETSETKKLKVTNKNTKKNSNDSKSNALSKTNIVDNNLLNNNPIHEDIEKYTVSFYDKLSTDSETDSMHTIYLTLRQVLHNLTEENPSGLQNKERTIDSKSDVTLCLNSILNSLIHDSELNNKCQAFDWLQCKIETEENTDINSIFTDNDHQIKIVPYETPPYVSVFGKEYDKLYSYLYKFLIENYFDLSITSNELNIAANIGAINQNNKSLYWELLNSRQIINRISRAILHPFVQCVKHVNESNTELSKFIVVSPENTFVRNFRSTFYSFKGIIGFKQWDEMHNFCNKEFKYFYSIPVDEESVRDADSLSDDSQENNTDDENVSTKKIYKPTYINYEKDQLVNLRRRAIWHHVKDLLARSDAPDGILKKSKFQTVRTTSSKNQNIYEEETFIHIQENPDHSIHSSTLFGNKQHTSITVRCANSFIFGSRIQFDTPPNGHDITSTYSILSLKGNNFVYMNYFMELPVQLVLNNVLLALNRSKKLISVNLHESMKKDIVLNVYNEDTNETEYLSVQEEKIEVTDTGFVTIQFTKGVTGNYTPSGVMSIYYKNHWLITDNKGKRVVRSVQSIKSNTNEIQILDTLPSITQSLPSTYSKYNTRGTDI